MNVFAPAVSQTIVLGLLWVWGLPPASAQSHLPDVEIEPELLALSRIRQRVIERLDAIPNYSCSETLERTRLTAKVRERLERRLAKAKGKGKEIHGTFPIDATDTVALEVAVVDGHELYAWPGGEFEERPLSSMIGYGASATGAFFGHLKSLFKNGQGRIRFSGDETLEGRAMLRYDYSVSLFRSRYFVTTTKGSAEIAYEGSFWAHADDYDLARLIVRGVDLPFQLGLDSMTTTIDYQQVPFDDHFFLLPAAVELDMQFSDGAQTINRTKLVDCRRYDTASELSFTSELNPSFPEEPVRPEQQEVLILPSGVELSIKLVTEIDSRDARTGDVVEAELETALKHEGRILAPEGSMALGRIRQLLRLEHAGQPYYTVALELTELRTDHAVARFEADLVRMAPAATISRSLNRQPDVQMNRRSYGSGALETIQVESDQIGPTGPFEAFYADGEGFRLRKGYKMTWRVTRSYTGEPPSPGSPDSSRR